MSSVSKSLMGVVCLVTGASRGIGKGIALQLGEAGATVYITGRKATKTDENQKSPLEETAMEVEKRGGTCFPVVCDHKDDFQVDALFEKIKKEQNGRLDVLVNCAFSAFKYINDNMGKPFWELDPSESWDEVNRVALRNYYRCSSLAARLMVPRKTGLIVNISSAGGMFYFHNVPYGVGKEGCDRMAADCSVELKPHNVAFVSIWPCPVMTESVKETLDSTEQSFLRDKILEITTQDRYESQEFTGMGIARLASDPKAISVTGKVLLSIDLAKKYGYKDRNGKMPLDYRSISDLMSAKHPYVAKVIPGFVRVPKWMFAMPGNKF
ncbi:hypothetical protein HELRODRAFT_187061 [Helobdella robusta]|uniref:Dehydrogenase/reductase SDR family member 1 n=1 Tax=Helobdella robusta TaxID=6412 RepID=T1FP65_HELRO|nr:hypothetical protein HELRODRAFT_187061 [Helobdella robusta]ESO03655.1 hypothetical protein HELRODRAFT_187061 [Helobdella robusta]